MNWPTATVAVKVTMKLALPLPSVVTIVEPSNVSPSPLPDGSQTALAKNSSLKSVVAVLLPSRDGGIRTRDPLNPILINPGIGIARKVGESPWQLPGFTLCLAGIARDLIAVSWSSLLVPNTRCRGVASPFG
jgi:hypothetical protein